MRLAWGALVVLVVALFAVRVIADGPFGKDFTIFLTGAHLIAGGQTGQLYDLGVQAQLQSGIGGGVVYSGGVLPFNYPPYVAALFLPLTLVSPEVAYYVWLGVQIVLLVAWIVWVVRSCAAWGLAAPFTAPHAVLAFQPIIETLLMGQMSLVLLVLWWWALISWKNERWGELGVAVALAAFKPQMVALLVVALLVDRRWRALAVAGLIQAALWLAALLIAGPGIVAGYLGILSTSASAVNTLGFVPSFMPNLRGLLTVVGVSPEATMWPSMLGWVASLVVTALIWCTGQLLSVKFGTTVVLAVLFSPHLYTHDVSLMAVAVVCALLVALSTVEAERRLNLLFVPYLLVLVPMYLLVFQVARSFAPMILGVWLLGVVLLWMLWRGGRRVAVVAGV
jgi:hypothetical protein